MLKVNVALPMPSEHYSRRRRGFARPHKTCHPWYYHTRRYNAQNALLEEHGWRGGSRAGHLYPVALAHRSRHERSTTHAYRTDGSIDEDRIRGEVFVRARAAARVD